MKLFYTTQNREIPDGFSARNPTYFDKPEGSATHVHVDGDYPEVVQGYEALQIDVTVAKSMPESVHEQMAHESEGAELSPEQMSVAGLREYLQGLGIEPKAKATKAELLELLAEQE